MATPLNKIALPAPKAVKCQWFLRIEKVVINNKELDNLT